MEIQQNVQGNRETRKIHVQLKTELNRVKSNGCFNICILLGTDLLQVLKRKLKETLGPGISGWPLNFGVRGASRSLAIAFMIDSNRLSRGQEHQAGVLMTKVVIQHQLLFIYRLNWIRNIHFQWFPFKGHQWRGDNATTLAKGPARECSMSSLFDGALFYINVIKAITWNGNVQQKWRTVPNKGDESRMWD